MDSRRAPRPYGGKYTLALIGKWLQKVIEEKILKGDRTHFILTNNVVMQENHSFRVVNVPHFFNDKYQHPDQLVIDLMALTCPGPHLFMLAVDPEDAREEKVKDQIKKLQETFGEEVTSHLVIVFPDTKSFNSLNELRESNMKILILTEDLARHCEKMCSERHSYNYEYTDYSQEVVYGRRTTLEEKRNNDHLQQRTMGDEAESQPSMSMTASLRGTQSRHQIGYDGHEASEVRSSIILLGLTGTGKSASGNTILSAGTPPLPPSQYFKSHASSLPVTTTCEIREIELFGRQVRVVDTPDFLHEDLQNRKTHIERCKTFGRPGYCKVLLVIQLSRFTDQEKGILERLEDMFGWEMGKITTVLLTHGEDLKGDPLKFLRGNTNLWEIIGKCEFRYHLFNNNSKDTKQVRQLVKKFPEWFADVQQSKKIFNR